MWKLIENLDNVLAAMSVYIIRNVSFNTSDANVIES